MPDLPTFQALARSQPDSPSIQVLSPTPPLIGCAGWNLPRASASHFPDAGSHLERYAQVFNAVEINSSFYRPHQPKTYARWAASTPPQFRFAVKLPRAITHAQRMTDVNEALQRFAGEVENLGEKLGCVLVQTPPSLRFNESIAEEFFSALGQRLACMLAFEARHRTWFTDAASALLRHHAVTRVIADPAAGQAGAHMPTTQSVYLRLHGSPTIYYSSYDADYLLRCADLLRGLAQAGRDAWCIFDNTAQGAATANALDLQAVLSGLRP